MYLCLWLLKSLLNKGLYMRKSDQEESNLSWNHTILLLNTILIPMAFFGISYLYNIRSTGEFFIRYLIQTFFIYWVVHLFAIPKKIASYVKENDKVQSSVSGSSARILDINDINSEYENTVDNEVSKNEKSERSNKWYFEIGIQQSFSISIFALTFSLSCIIPIALPIGSLFFWIKYLIDKYNMMFEYRIEYEANPFIREKFWVFTCLAVLCYQFVMVVWFLWARDDDITIMSFLLLIISIFSAYYFISKSPWKKKKEQKELDSNTDAYDEYKTDSNQSSSNLPETKMIRKSKYSITDYNL